MRVSGLILAGGLGRRMKGQDKGWVNLGSKPMIELVINRLKPQVDEIIINANRNIERYQQSNQRIIEDVIQGYQGPLAGILSGLTICESEYIVCVPCDCPFFPADLVVRMLNKQHSTSADVVSVTDGKRTHPVFALIKVDLKNSLSDYLQSGQRKIDLWYQLHHYQLVEYPDGEAFFENINTPEQLQMAEKRVVTHG